MKKARKLFIGMTIATLALIGCKKHEVVPEPTDTQYSALNNLFDEYVDSKTQNFSVDANTFNVLYGNQGTRIVLSGYNFSDTDGNPINGTVDIELIELYTLPAMIATNKATMGIQNGQLAPLSSGGEFYISVTQNGSPVTVVSPLQVTTIGTPNASNMQLFNGTINQEGDMLWNLDNPITLPVDTAGLGNIFGWDGDYNWVNCDYFFQNPNPQTSVTVSIPSYCNDEDTRVYVAIPSETVLTSLSKTVANTFGTGSYYSLPEGLNIYTIVITVDNNQIKYAIEQSTIGTNHTVDITSLTAVASLDELELVLQPYF